MSTPAFCTVPTESGAIAVAIDQVGILVLAVQLSDPNDLSYVRARVRSGPVVYIAAFARHPGAVYAIRIDPGERAGVTISQGDAVLFCGPELVQTCTDIATRLAHREFHHWREYEEDRISALRALLDSSIVGEA